MYKNNFIEMSKLIIITISVSTIFFEACKNKVNSYENKLGIRPASLAEIDTANYTKIQWEDTIKNFGSINEGNSVLIKFKFKNTGKTVLYILATLPSCGCTVTDYPTNAILPGDEGFVTATFNSLGHPGNVTKYIMVKTNTINKITQQLEFSGEVIKNNQSTRK
jgi:hypothetical protein